MAGGVADQLVGDDPELLGAAWIELARLGIELRVDCCGCGDGREQGGRADCCAAAFGEQTVDRRDRLDPLGGLVKCLRAWADWAAEQEDVSDGLQAVFDSVV